MHIVEKYRELGSYRAAGRACGVDHKTVKVVVDRVERGEAGVPRALVVREHNYDGVDDVVRRRVAQTQGRITAKRLLPVARAEGYDGSDRNFRRLVADAKADYRRHGRIFRPWRPAPGEFLAIDYGTWAGWHVFCAVLVWSRIRFVRITRDEQQPTTLALLAECFETIGGVPAVVLADRIACLRGPIVADRVVAHPAYVRFAAHYGFRPDWCESADPQSKGVVENLVGYAKTDLVIPACDEWTSLTMANVAARQWCDEVNTVVHSEIAAVPADRLAEEVKVLRPLPSLRAAIQRGEARKVDRLATVRFGSARYSVPARLVGAQVWVSVAGDQVLIDHGDDRVAEHPVIAWAQPTHAHLYVRRPVTAPNRLRPPDKALLRLPDRRRQRCEAAPRHHRAVCDRRTGDGHDRQPGNERHTGNPPHPSRPHANVLSAIERPVTPVTPLSREVAGSVPASFTRRSRVAAATDQPPCEPRAPAEHPWLSARYGCYEG